MHDDCSPAYNQLHERVQRWVWRQGWQDLRDAQERAIAPILAGDRDVIISAATAAGKTEAAFLPICSRLVDSEPKGVRALSVSPLRALINDQYQRLGELCRDLNVPVHRWHGDVPAGHKQSVIDEPDGILIITPESLEALFVLQGRRLRDIFGSLEWIVLDELHVFIGSERGRQLQSLLNRLDLLVRRRVPRIGLSATLGDMRLAAEYLRPHRPDGVELIESTAAGQELRVQVRGELAKDRAEETVDIGRHLFKVLRGSNNLVFATSRSAVEGYADFLRRESERLGVPNEFLPHHGSLSREHREDVEARLKAAETPFTAVCTSTLELGIDVGDVTSVAHIGAPTSVASLRQRLGRSGRRGAPSVLRLYIPEADLTEASPAVDGLREELVHTVAAVELLLARWCEPPSTGQLHLSTLVHQILSLIAQHSGVRAKEAWTCLSKAGPFQAVDDVLFAALLRRMGAAEMITQMDDGTLLLGSRGEQAVNHYSFYAVFQTRDELRLEHCGRTLGTLATEQALVVGSALVFAGRRWRVVAADRKAKVVSVEPAPGGRVPRFEAARSGLVHDDLRRKMRSVYEGEDIPEYLNATARKFLDEARSTYRRVGFDRDPIAEVEGDALLFLCRGDRIMNTVSAQLTARGLRVTQLGPVLEIAKAGRQNLAGQLQAILEEGPVDELALAASVGNKEAEKFDDVLGEELLSAEYASRALDGAGALAALQEIVR